MVVDSYLECRFLFKYCEALSGAVEVIYVNPKSKNLDVDGGSVVYLHDILVEKIIKINYATA